MNLLAQIELARSGPTLCIMLVLPLVGAAIIAGVSRSDPSRLIALLVAGINVILSFLLLGAMRRAGDAQLQFLPGELFVVGGPPHFSFTLGVDQISIWLLLLTTILTLVALLGSYRIVRERFTSFAAWMLVLESATLGAFVARDVLLFYFFFELTLVPTFFLINGWGGPERRRGAARFFLFTFAGSIFMLASILYVGISAGSFEMDVWTRHLQNALSPQTSWWVILGLLIGLLVKVPLIPFHSWLPLAYVQASAPVTALLSGLLAKLGTYGLLRLVMPGLIEQTAQGQTLAHPTIVYVIAVLSVIGILAMALVAWLQTDAKSLLAYGSVSHLGFCVLALTSITTLGMQASLLYMVNHGITSAGLFLILGMIERRTGTREMASMSGLGRQRPWLGFFFVLFVMSSIGLPLTNGFVSEFLSIASAMTAEHLGVGFMVLAACGIVLGAIYMLHLTARLIFGQQRMPDNAPGGGDLQAIEIASLAPLAILVIVLGIAPNLILKPSRAALEAVSSPIPVSVEISIKNVPHELSYSHSSSLSESR